ncbi:MAG: hypothetical protein OXJ55_04480 [Caldilineaceae bacterium]|nr:hypothetical protein [Caldilineaceae bacterium]
MTNTSIALNRQNGAMPVSVAEVRSVPALAAKMRQIDTCALPSPYTEIFNTRSVSPAYLVQNHVGAREVQTAVTTIAQVADKLRRMSRAYGEWQEFDIPAFFDLWPEHAPLLVHVQERVSTVNVTFFADLLLPSFQRAEQYWAREFFPAYQTARPPLNTSADSSSFTSHFLDFEQPKMRAYWDKLIAVMGETRRALWNDIDFLAATAGGEEKTHWQWAWRGKGPPGLDRRLLPPLQQLPTLTLGVEFPLPASRQPGRVRRLRRTWEGDARRRLKR